MLKPSLVPDTEDMSHTVFSPSLTMTHVPPQTACCPSPPQDLCTCCLLLPPLPITAISSCPSGPRETPPPSLACSKPSIALAMAELIDLILFDFVPQMSSEYPAETNSSALEVHSF